MLFFTKEDILYYMKYEGFEAAKNLLSLISPDRFKNNKDYTELQKIFNI